MPGLIAPSILSFDLSMLGESVPRLVAAGASPIHFDVMDGRWVPPITFGDALVRSLRDKTDAFFEVHLMVEEPERQFEPFASAGAKRILFHAEGTNHAHRLAQTLRGMGVEAGLALNPGTPVDVAFELADVLDMVLVMTVNPGWGGQKFLPSSLDRIRRVKERMPHVLVEVDGGVVPETAREAREAGADVFVVGSYLLRGGDLEGNVAEMRSCVR